MTSNSQSKENSVLVSEHDWCVRLISQNDVAGVAAYQILRHEYFTRKCQWVKTKPNFPGLEFDSYDESCWHLGVFDSQGQLRAYLRMLLWYQDTGFMLEREFRCLLCDEGLQNIQRENSIEVSRMVVAEGLGCKATLRAIELLFKALYRFCLWEGVQHLYAVVEEEWLAWCRRHFGLSFHCISASIQLPCSKNTIVIYASLHELEQSAGTSPEKSAWYKDVS